MADHVEIRVTGPEPAAREILAQITRLGDGRRIVAGRAGRGPYDRRDGRVAFYLHVQVDVTAPAGPPSSPPAGKAGLCPEPGCGRRIGLSRHGLLASHYKGTTGRPVRCPGTGQPPAEDGPDA